MPGPLDKHALRELTIDTMASWALEGMEPSAETLADIRDFVAGRVTADQLRAKIKNTGHAD